MQLKSIILTISTSVTLVTAIPVGGDTAADPLPAGGGTPATPLLASGGTPVNPLLGSGGTGANPLLSSGGTGNKPPQGSGGTPHKSPQPGTIIDADKIPPANCKGVTFKSTQIKAAAEEGLKFYNDNTLRPRSAYPKWMARADRNKKPFGFTRIECLNAFPGLQEYPLFRGSIFSKEDPLLPGAYRVVFAPIAEHPDKGAAYYCGVVAHPPDGSNGFELCK